MGKPIHTLKHLKENRTALRKQLTAAEATLWNALRGSQLEGRKFIRQHSIGNYIADFYCKEERLIIELDGHGHFTTGGQQYDSERDEWLTSLEYTVLRFENKLVFSNLEGVLLDIARHFKSQKK